ncbi:MAG: YARHG domain-containing protein [Candidatus Berkelbacteria bacterium]|nr:YARHG domain-containing protein [Candidatus Berkelbacteria bacterium]
MTDKKEEKPKEKPPKEEVPKKAQPQEAAPKESLPQPQTPPKNSSAWIIILIVVLALVILGVGGFFGWKYFIKGKLTKTANKTSTNTSSSSKISLKKLEEMFTYPTGTLTATDHTEKFGAKSELGFTTADKLKTVYDYYLNLATKQNLTVSRKTLEPDLSSAAITIQGKDYYVDISLYQYENTEFTVSIYGDNITNDTANTTTSTNTGTSTPTSNSSKATISNEYVISDSNTRVITTAELTSLTPWQLKVARNEIYARHGREFVHKDLQCYFGGKSWYKVDPNFIESVLSTTENKNIATIQSYEQSISSPLASKDSGC